MSSTVSPHAGDAALGGQSQALELQAQNLWWLWLMTGVVWIVAALVILQFDAASVSTVGVIIGCMFVFAGMTSFLQAAVADHLRWLSIVFGVLMLIAGILCFVNPEATFAGLADMLGFLFLLVGVWWTVEAFLVQAGNPLWWLSLIAGVLMMIVAFWTAGQFFIEKAYTLLVVAGIWALLRGVTDIVRGFQLRNLTL
ncbi:DUF308 domain-containing protein [Solirubrobacter phytolaccae]|uniref:DUF308 domain-containing protein n=1 Tax=Solirubrobacter phytolaccae TaxID=1404360 RepID=A0A9X3SFD2_9ACTN|nr:DUF308 domain-containing protein [Solirubrobacter phytolaccae]MDA0181367.1 DUF308 domain-containing protein [Solirubrobacter phytolaccae]